MRSNVSLEEAQTLLLNAISPVEVISVSLNQSFGRVLGEDISAGLSIPSFARAAMDGYAFSCADVKSAGFNEPASLKVQPASSHTRIESGSCSKIMTGDPIPSGADTVIQYEKVLRHGDTIFISHPLPVGENIIPIGDDVRAGDLLGSRGSIISSPLAAVLAAQGKIQVNVFRTVKIAVICTGNELVDPAGELTAGKTYNSIGYGLAARCRELGCEPLDLGICSDQVEQMVACLTRGSSQADLVVVTGGISVGDSDLVPEALTQMGTDFLLRGVAMKPGSPFLAASGNGKLIIGLSGNPAAALVSFELIGIPLIKKLMGLEAILPARFTGMIADSFSKASPQRRLLRARLMPDTGNTQVKLTGEQGNAVLKSLLDCDALVDIPAGSGPVAAGQPVNGFLVGRHHDFLTTPG